MKDWHHLCEAAPEVLVCTSLFGAPAWCRSAKPDTIMALCSERSPQPRRRRFFRVLASP